MALKQNRVEIVIQGEKIAYYLNPTEVPIYEKAEEMITAEVDKLRENPFGRNLSSTKFLKALIVRFVVEIIKKDMESSETLHELNEMNSQLENYLKK